MSWGIEHSKKRKDILDLMDIGVRKTMANPNYVNEVKKSTNGCWMDQIYGLMRCDICDLSNQCPVREEEEWQAWLKENNMMVEKKKPE
ncbi:hypothetical protein FGF66_11870 [Chlorobaculum thiosulfatiphilum]|jgi:hypothetical protein|uniref:Uncharacterized protein n=1 Tax=Chlorobaculum thiosulfatiphilum TaxID=115852 RepID=A0A5C4S077_CHLTI|nr:hypothetical protein [Chlorobaculum thiosulfatiphilum]NTV82403.1 hypothetical protein [Chlorobaculum sp.]TNJ36427.1 hypothetical protein FGF66_11870 [Chlorobaculum thiosulfatiphilum]